MELLLKSVVLLLKSICKWLLHAFDDEYHVVVVYNDVIGTIDIPGDELFDIECAGELDVNNDIL